ncbi:N-glycosyltransferase [bacterium]|nr:MAG: N-glycosyltransferase [bacterium]
MTLVEILVAIQHHWFYLAALIFFAWYPILTSLMWIFTGIVYFVRRELPDNEEFYKLDEFPRVSFLIPAYNEARHIRHSLEGMLLVDYPDFEIVVIDDGSTDTTVREILPLVRDGRVRLIRKLTNEGKAMALNDAVRVASGEILVVMDADAQPVPELLRVIVPHFKSPRVGGVTGNPRVVNRFSFLAKMQAIEFTSIISLQRRAQRIWGRILTMSGVIGAFHRDAMLDAGLYSPDMATEDIDLTWKLQLRHWDIRYEPRAVVWMHVPSTLGGLWHQRTRWALGLAQVLRRHAPALLKWRHRRLWPVLLESGASMLWAYTYTWMMVLWILSYSLGYPPVGASPIPNWWGMMIGTVCLMQLLTGVFLDRRYDQEIGRYFGIAVFYPILYWILLAIITTWSSPRAWLQRKKRSHVRWATVRDA